MQLLKQLLYHLVISAQVFREKGMWAGLVTLGQTILRILYQHDKYIIITKELSDQAFLPAPIPRLVHRRMTSREEIAQLGQIANLADMARFYEMFDQGSIALAAFLDDQVVGCCWGSREIDGSLNRVRPPLRPGDIYAHDLFVSPAHRGQGIGKALVSHRIQVLREQGYRRIIAAIRQANAPALKVHEKDIHIGKISHTRILFWSFSNFEQAQKSRDQDVPLT